MSDLLDEAFAYDELEEETRAFVLGKTREIHGLIRRTAEEIILIGENLRLVRQHLPDMKFAAWLRAEFDFSRQTAYNFMRVADKLGGSCKTVLQLPARVLYELASSSEAILEQVETGQLPPTLGALRAAKEAEQQAREAEQLARADVAAMHERLHSLQGEVAAQQAAIARLSQNQEETCQQPDEEPVSAEVEQAEPPTAIREQMATLHQQVATLTHQRDLLAQQLAALQEHIRAGAPAGGEAEYTRQVRLNWYRITNDFQRGVRTLLSQWPSALDVLAFEADDWARLSQTKELVMRLLKECTALTECGASRIVESDAAPIEEATSPLSP